MVWFVYGILIFFIPFILYAIMKNTKRSGDLLAQILLVQIKTFKESNSDPASTKNLETPALPRETLGSFLFNKPASESLKPLHKEPARKPPKSTTLKLGSTYNETDQK
jgi:hypothetical protein